MSREEVVALREAARPLASAAGDYHALLEAVGDARYVLLGEATHGTREFYAARAAITRRLVEERGFAAVVVEADWPDALRVHRYVRGAGDDADATAALRGFERFPTWMWRNTEVVALVEWLRHTPHDVGFYGMDLYSLFTSIESVLCYLDRVDPEAARRARERYACFDPFLDDPARYGRAAYLSEQRSCEEAVAEQVAELRRRAAEPGRPVDDERFFAEQNARLVASAERYYRALYGADEESWNRRDAHMADTLDALVDHLDRARAQPTKLVVWAHNSHLGDAGATEMGWRRREHNVGQLLRERHGEAVFNVGFTTHTGTVTAADSWGDDPVNMRVRPSLEGSWERLLHAAGEGGDFHVVLRGQAGAMLLGRRRLERAIGVIYRPRNERWVHYFEADLAAQFDAVVHFDHSHAVEPLEWHQTWQPDKAETFPTGL